MFAKIMAEDPTVMPAWQILRMATIEGAMALGVGDRIGSIEVGKEADLIMLDLTKPPLTPVLTRPARNVVANLVYAETGRNVTMAMVAGKIIYENGCFTNIDVDAITGDIAVASTRFPDAVGLDPVATHLPIVELTGSGLN